MKDIRAVVLRRADFQVLAALTVSLLTPLTAMPASRDLRPHRCIF
jgi:hypothetical protein